MAYAEFRFYEELNDFLKTEKRKQTFRVAFDGQPKVRTVITRLGVPHPEIDLILVNGRSVGFDQPLNHGDRVAVYPMFESLDISPLVRLRPYPLRRTAFILDVHLGKLARGLRLLGFDCCYRNDLDDPQIIRRSLGEHRIILTRDRRLLQDQSVQHGYWVRASDPDTQVGEVLMRFDLLDQIKAFTRCTVCNGSLAAIAKAAVSDRLQPKTSRYYDEFWMCTDCRRLYWKGTHYRRLVERVRRWSRKQPAKGT
ncbi:MAG: Mut7-C RNAse domain-containing protein [Desulfobacterales bacterium]|nr:Mut7-C RNAse domain-containing protein [Desulfobacterales bacterium]